MSKPIKCGGFIDVPVLGMCEVLEMIPVRTKNQVGRQWKLLKVRLPNGEVTTIGPNDYSIGARISEIRKNRRTKANASDGV